VDTIVAQEAQDLLATEHQEAQVQEALVLEVLVLDLQRVLGQQEEVESNILPRCLAMTSLEQK
jgi:hypothetical protein